MKTTKASTNATTYGEYLEQREKELQEEVEFWHRAWKDTRTENEALKAENELLAQKATTWQTWYKNLNEFYRRFFTEWDIVPKE